MAKTTLIAKAYRWFVGTFGNVDRGMDICAAGCFADSLKSMGTASNPHPPMLWQHYTDEPIGEWLEMVEDSKGLKVRGVLWLGKGIAKAEQAHLLLKSKRGGMSIGYITRKALYDEKKGTRTLLAVELKEGSVVTFPMNEKARVTGVKSEGDAQARTLAAISSMLTKSANENAAALIRARLRDGVGKFQSMNQFIRGTTAPTSGAVTV